jgi:hypothetical protein
VGKPGVERVMLMEDSSNQARRNGSRIGADHVALAIDVLDTEGGIDGCLVGIGGRSG